jgi:hypothetical protein
MANDNDNNKNDEVQFLETRHRGDRGGISVGRCKYCNEQVIGAPNPGSVWRSAVAPASCPGYVFYRRCLERLATFQGICPICYEEHDWDAALDNHLFQYILEPTE